MSQTNPLLFVLGVFVASFATGETFEWSKMPTGRWVPVPTRGTPAPKVFHGGATIVPERGLMMFFGSDTHAPTPLERGESNAVWRLDLASLRWSQDYIQDPKSTYRLLPDGQAETTTGRPWAMHTFAAVDWDPVAGRVVAVSGPVHARFEPELRFPMFRGAKWWEKLKASHWEYDLDTKRWTRLDLDAPPLFAEALVWDSGRQRLVGHNGEFTWEFDRPARTWRRFAAPSKPGWHLNMVYDTLARRVLLLGHNTVDNTLFAYGGEQRVWSTVEATSKPLPANGAAIAYDTRNHVMLYLANDFGDQYSNPGGKSVTFIYHSAGKQWQRLAVNSPELYGMNYLMQYDPARNVFLHFEKSHNSGERIRVWAFRYR
jgi:hypothetical protein